MPGTFDQQADLAVVTGASSGIGIDFADELHQRGYRLLLTGRDEQRLEQVRARLQTGRAGMETIDIACLDLNESTGPRQLLEQACQLGTPRVLINNAGVGDIGDFLAQSPAAWEAMIETNIVSLTRLCQLFATEMARQAGGYILNHASFSALQPPSRYAVYAATKSYVLTLSEALHQHLASRRVSVTALCSGFFDSGFLEKIGQPTGGWVDWMTLDSRRVAQAGLRGMFRSKSLVVPGWRYKFLRLLLGLFPRKLMIGVADYCLDSARSQPKKD